MSDFQKPFASPPTIFGITLLLGVEIGLFFPWPVLPWFVQIGLGPLIVLAGVLAIRQSIKDIETAETTYDPYAASTHLVTSGIYQHSRNPGYLGLAIIQLGAAVLFDNVWIVLTGAVAICITTYFVIRLEELKLTNAFGGPYTDYVNRVRRWI